jgi:hypothetical protein
MVILENLEKKNQIWTNYDEELHVTKFDCRFKEKCHQRRRTDKLFLILQ